ncbi:ATP-dependent DNA helicase DinG [Actinopolymorpha cephalotaxi]|uniref:ATP-dependent helicase DinG n=1 Tax=Actinopolymorpha cephalotaxi TaxID=504797 RepID=A0A1I2QYF8_9ACTN|nr:ATP-dependent DNA helicase [Actinopolymorpha cephalotaxi]NYH82420.1 ATP-dependent DNA helicase DinG [Actinopolymorpha cephalotaxi]SFG33515.1 ATP-dependent DNA helicase DinG [Actinopolymorpha cephalotaxi]
MADAARGSADQQRPDHRVRELLHDAVDALAGMERPGQLVMADAVARAISTGEHLVVQAGTGTGKSLAYLIPAFLNPGGGRRPVVVATATLALQSQLVGRDLPQLAEAIEKRLERHPSYAILKGRHNYACLHRVRDGVPDEQGALLERVPSGPLGRQVLELRSWAAKQAQTGGDGDRDAAPTHQDRAWAQVAVSSRECLGAQRCPYGAECFAERARERAHGADVIVTNHALLAIDALENISVLPDYDVVIIDEAHELAARVTGTASAELSPGMIERAARRATPFCEGGEADPLEDAGEALRSALASAPLGRVETPSSELTAAVALVRDSARAAWSAFPSEKKDSDAESGRRQARSYVEQIRDVAERVSGLSPYDVVWVAERERGGPELRVAPLSVAGLLREKLLSERTCVLTSATLKLGGDFDSAARSVGLRPVDRIPDGEDGAGRKGRGGSETGGEPATDRTGDQDGGSASEGGKDIVEPLPWRGLDVGSPFDYERQAILYVARRLAPPGRGGISPRVLDEVSELVEAAGGATLGLFSSRRAAEEAAAAVRDRLGVEVLCQGEGQLSELHRRFAAEPDTSLFGTLSLWQGLDVPGDACQLVIIDRIPFPRPDDPLTSARQRAVDEAGGNGFMSVAATHAALLLAQGVGRLIRRSTDRGVVAVLDPRLVTARYGNYLRASLPPMWFTGDRDVALGALRRLRSAREE